MQFIFLTTLLSAFFLGINGFKVMPTGRLLRNTMKMAVSEVVSAETFDAAIKAAGSNLVIVDYSTTWCGPCKVVLPKYVELSEKYKDVVFLKCIGDISAEASALMKREGVRSVPTFHFWKNGAKVEVVSGARIEEVEAAITSNQ
eukprot:gene12198-25627_t